MPDCFVADSVLVTGTSSCFVANSVLVTGTSTCFVANSVLVTGTSSCFVADSVQNRYTCNYDCVVLVNHTVILSSDVELWLRLSLGMWL